MSEYGEYRVTGNRAYRGHDPGTTFMAKIPPAAEQRAVYRGDIALLRRITPDLVPGTFTLPRGWAETGDAPSNQGRMSASLA